VCCCLDSTNVTDTYRSSCFSDDVCHVLRAILFHVTQFRFDRLQIYAILFPIMIQTAKCPSVLDIVLSAAIRCHPKAVAGMVTR